MNGNGSTAIMVMAATKAIITLLLVSGAVYCWVSGQELPPGGLEVVLAILGVYFGFSARMYQVDAKRVRNVEQIMVGRVD